MAAAILPIVLALVPEVPALITALSNLRKKYPAMTDAQVTALVAAITQQADTAFDQVLAEIAADHAAPPKA